MLKQPQEPNEEGSVTRHPNDRSGGRFVRLALVPGVILGVIAAVVLVFASPASAWNYGTPTAQSSCPNGTAVITGTFTNNEPVGNDMSVTMTSQYGSDGPKTVPANGQPVSFTINTGQQSLSAGDVTFNMAWANGNPGTDQVTAHYDAINCGPPDNGDTQKVQLCHATGSATNPYVYIEPSVNAFYQEGHIGHAGDIWATFTYIKNGQSITVPGQGDQSLLNYRNPDCVKPPTTTEVTPGAPTATTPDCDNPNSTVTAGNQPEVIWAPTLPLVLQPGQSQTVTATPATGYAFPQNAQTSWTFTNDFDVKGCETPPNVGSYNGQVTTTCHSATGIGAVDKGFGSSVVYTLKVGRSGHKLAQKSFTVAAGRQGQVKVLGSPGAPAKLYAKGKLISNGFLKKGCGTPPTPPTPPNNPPTTPPASCTSASCVPTATAETGLGDLIGSSTQPHRGAGWTEAITLLMSTMVGLLGLLIVRRRPARLGLLRRQ